MARILLLDDSAPFRRVLSRALRDEGHTVTEAADGSVAYNRSVVSESDVAVTDIDMPNVNGIEAILTMQKIAPNLPIVAMSGGGAGDDDDYLNVCQELGVSTILKKPFEPDVMIAAVQAALAHSASPDNG